MRETSQLRTDFFTHGKVADCPVYDLHGHMGPFYGINFTRHSTDAMVRSMDNAGVRMLVFCHHAALMSPQIGNNANIEAVRAYPDRLRAYCGINPNYPEIARKDLESFDAYSDVYAGLKFLADYHGYPISHERYMPAWELAENRSLPVLLHTWGGSGLDGPEQVRIVAEKYPNTRLLLGHSCHGEWDKAVALVKDFPNVYLELCAVLHWRGILDRFVAELGSERIVFGTDLPWFSYHYYIGAVLGADIADDDRRNILYRNAERLLYGSQVTP